MTRKIWYDIDYSFKEYFSLVPEFRVKTYPELFRGMLEICWRTWQMNRLFEYFFSLFNVANLLSSIHEEYFLFEFSTEKAAITCSLCRQESSLVLRQNYTYFFFQCFVYVLIL